MHDSIYQSQEVTLKFLNGVSDHVTEIINSLYGM
jgi:hypothetical protein